MHLGHSHICASLRVCTVKNNVFGNPAYSGTRYSFLFLMWERSSQACCCGRTWPGPLRIRDLQVCSSHSTNGRGPNCCHLICLWNRSLDQLLTTFHAETVSPLILLLCIYEQFIERFSPCATTLSASSMCIASKHRKTCIDFLQL
jgi:hypothetical protein